MKTCILIGSGPGIGEAVAHRFGQAGYRVGLIARSKESLDEQVKHLSENSVHGKAAVADAGDLVALKRAVEYLKQEIGGCDVLVYNAAVLSKGAPLELTPEMIQQEFRVNVLGAHVAVKVVAPDMIERGEGTILFTGGGLSLEPFPEWTSLALGKAALRSLGFSLFKELMPKGIRVSVMTVCGIVEKGTGFGPELIAEEYWRVVNTPQGLGEREVIIQPAGSDLFYNDPSIQHLS